jgi:MinD-like ATPase involved in chromosome partitioning or flagellar assembly
MLRELYDLFEKKTEVVLNKVLHDISSKSGQDEMQTMMKDIYQVPLLGIIPCFCDVLKSEGNIIFPLDKPDHPFAKILDEMANRIDKNFP